MIRFYPVGRAAVVALFLLTSCREAPLAPFARDGGAPIVEPASRAAPRVTALGAEVRGDTLLIRAQLMMPAGSMPDYSTDQIGGWSLQLFLNVDQLPTGYARGYDYVVRGSEVSSDRTLAIRSTEAGDGPGGWGREVGRAPFELHPRVVTIAVPLASIRDEGVLDYTLETYQMVACDDCEGGVTANFVGAWSGTTGRHTVAFRSPRPRAFNAMDRQPGI